jgi:predicted lipid-binding transport protein (Tim44 family)
MTPAAGRRGSRSDSQPTRANSAAVVCESPPSPPVAVALPAPPRRHPGRDWIGPVAGVAAGFLLGHLVLGAFRPEPIGSGVGAILLQAVGTLATVWFLLRRRAKARWRAPVVVAPPTQEPPRPVRETDLDRGVRDIRRTDRGFDAARFAGYAAMMFRDVQRAGVARGAGALRDRVTPAMLVELEARCHRLRAIGRSVRVAEVEITAEVTEAWQDGDRDYVTAYVAGSMQSHTVDDGTRQVVDGVPALPVAVSTFLTFTRPAGLNFWMLSVVQEE